MLERHSKLSVGQQIRRERVYLCLSQAKLAEIIKVSISSINRWENDKTTPHLYYRKQLCVAFSMQIEEIFSYQAREE